MAESHAPSEAQSSPGLQALGGLILSLPVLIVAWLLNRHVADGQSSWMYWAIPAVMGIGFLFLNDRGRFPVAQMAIASSVALLAPVAILVSGSLLAPEVAGLPDNTSRPSEVQRGPVQRGPTQQELEHARIRAATEACLRGELPANVDAQTGQDFCSIVYDTQGW